MIITDQKISETTPKTLSARDRDRVRVARVEDGLEGVDRAGADVAEDHAQRADEDRAPGHLASVAYPVRVLGLRATSEARSGRHIEEACHLQARDGLCSDRALSSPTTTAPPRSGRAGRWRWQCTRRRGGARSTAQDRGRSRGSTGAKDGPRTEAATHVDDHHPRSPVPGRRRSPDPLRRQRRLAGARRSCSPAPGRRACTRSRRCGRRWPSTPACSPSTCRGSARPSAGTTSCPRARWVTSWPSSSPRPSWARPTSSRPTSGPRPPCSRPRPIRSGSRA